MKIRNEAPARQPKANLLTAALAGLGAIVWCALPWLLAGRLSLSIFVFIGLYTAMVVGLTLLVGYAGQGSLGHAAFYGLGAYLTGIVTVKLGLSPWLGMLAAVVFTGLIAYVIGRPILILRGHYLVVAMLGLNIILEVLFQQWAGLTGGPNGLTGIKPLAIGSLKLTGDRFYFYLASAFALAAMLMAANLARSRFGRALQAIRSSEVAAQASGVDPAHYKNQTFVFSAVLAGLAGAFYAHYLTFISPSSFNFSFSVQLLMMAVIGGTASVPGAALGVAVATLLREAIRDVLPKLLGSASTEYETVVFGVLLAVIVIFAPDGVAPMLRRLLPKSKARFVSAGLTARPLQFERPAGDGPLVSVTGLTRRFGGLVAVRDVTTRVEAGQIFCVIGPNGAGKSTLLNMISGVLTPSAGEVRIGGRSLTKMSAHAVARLGVARTFQTPRLVPQLTALENVMIGLHPHLRAGFLRSAFRLAGPEEREAQELALGALEMVGAAHLADEPVGSLPFGAHRLVEMARALALRPRLLLLDEPASGLTGPERAELGALIRRIRDAGVSVMLIEHDVPLVMELADRILVLHHGEPIAEGDPASVRQNPAVIAAYLGSSQRAAQAESARETDTAPVREAASVKDAKSASAAVGSPGGSTAGSPGGSTTGPAADSPGLVITDLTAGYGAVQVLRGVSVELRPGEIIGIVGPNGAGKSTLMRAVTGLLPARGRVQLGGQDILGERTERITAMGLSLVPERRQLLESMTVHDHLILGAYPRKASRAELEEDLAHVYSLFPILRERLGQTARSLSGGQQQMLAIARALMAKPRFLLLDEPLLGLAPQVVEDIIATVSRLREEGIGIALVEQNAAAVLPAVDRAYVLEHGSIVFAGTAAEAAGAVEVEAAFLGK